MARYDREELYADVWSTPIWKIAQKNGIGESTLSHVCRRLHIPAPGAGYWSKSAAARAAEPKPALPTAKVKPRAEAFALPGKQVVDRPELTPIQITDVRAQRRPIHTDTAEERNSVLTQIAREIATGQTLAAACRQAGISEKKYRRWYRQQPMLPPVDVATIAVWGPMHQACSESARTESMPRVSAKLLCTHDREKLYGEVWSMPMLVLAKQYGVSNVTLWGRCRKLYLPLPVPGHWRRLESGLLVQSRPPLPEIQIIDEQKEWKSNVYSLSEIALKSQCISDAVSGGKTLEEACRITRIAMTTYRRWRKRRSGIENQAPARLLQSQDAPQSL